MSIVFGHSLRPINRWNFGFDVKQVSVLRKAALVRDRNPMRYRGGWLIDEMIVVPTGRIN